MGGLLPRRQGARRLRARPPHADHRQHPLLTKVLPLPFGGTSPFRADVVYVSRKVFTNLKWGTKEPVVFRDTELDMVRLRAFGIFTIRVADPQLFVNTLVGSQEGLHAQVEGYLRDVIVSRLNDVLGETLKTILDLPRHYDELGSALKSRVLDDFGKYGVEMTDFFVNAITPPEEVQKLIDERAGMGALGNMQRYMQYKTARAVEAAASNPSGAGEGMGLGLGAGFGVMMPGMIRDAMQGGGGTGGGPGGAAAAGASAAAAAPPATPCPACTTPIPQGAKFCPGCGPSSRQPAPAPPAVRRCPRVPGSVPPAGRRALPRPPPVRAARPRCRRARSSARPAARSPGPRGVGAAETAQRRLRRRACRWPRAGVTRSAGRTPAAAEGAPSRDGAQLCREGHRALAGDHDFGDVRGTRVVLILDGLAEQVAGRSRPRTLLRSWATPLAPRADSSWRRACSNHRLGRTSAPNKVAGASARAWTGSPRRRGRRSHAPLKPRLGQAQARRERRHCSQQDESTPVEKSGQLHSSSFMDSDGRRAL